MFKKVTKITPLKSVQSVKTKETTKFDLNDQIFFLYLLEFQPINLIIK